MTDDKFIPKLHLRQPGFTDSTFRQFTKHHERIQKFKETGDLHYIYKKKLDKACRAHDEAYANSKDLTKSTISDKILKDRDCKIALNPKYDGYQRGLVSKFYKFFLRKQDQ